MTNHILKILISLLVFTSFAKINVQGVPQEIEQNIIKRLEYKLNVNQIKITPQATEQIIIETKSAIRPYGYFNADVSLNKNHQHITLQIKLNEPAHFSELSLTLTDIPDQPSLQSSLEKESSKFIGKTFSLENIYTLESTLKSLTVDYGYYDSIITRGKTSVDKHNNTAEIEMIIDLKHKIMFGDIILPDDATAKCFERYHQITKNESYKSEKIHDFQHNMMNSGLFQTSNIRSVPRQDQPHIQDIIVEYTHTPPVKYFAGIGLRSNLNDHKVSPQLQLNIKFNNLNKCGLSLANSFKFTKESYSLDSDLVIPVVTGVDDFNMISLKAQSNQIQNNDASTFAQIDLFAQRRYQNWIFQASLNHLHEKSSIDDTDVDSLTAYTTSLTYPQFRAIFDYAGSLLKTSLKTKFLGGSDTLGSDISFFQFTTTFSLQYKHKSVLFDHTSAFGKTDTDDFDKFPLSMQFYLGGSSSLRGVKYQEYNQGKSFGLVRNSLQGLVYDNIYTGIFLDNGFCNLEDSTETDFKPAAGIITSYATPYGKFDLSIGRLLDDSKWVILFNAEPEME